MNAPFASVSAVRVPNWEVAMITAPAMPRPVGSTTRPAMVPVVSSCARLGGATARRSAMIAAHERTLFFILNLPPLPIHAAARRPARPMSARRVARVKHTPRNSRMRNIRSRLGNASEPRELGNLRYGFVIGGPAGACRSIAGPGSEGEGLAQVAGERRIDPLEGLADLA